MSICFVFQQYTSMYSTVIKCFGSLVKHGEFMLYWWTFNLCELVMKRKKHFVFTYLFSFIYEITLTWLYQRYFYHFLYLIIHVITLKHWIRFVHNMLMFWNIEISRTKYLSLFKAIHYYYRKILRLTCIDFLFTSCIKFS
jgi:hypothetical protein